MGTYDIFDDFVAARARVHNGIGNTEVLPDVGTDPIGGILVVHWRLVDLVLARAWHVQVLCPLVELHAESELSLLLSNGVCLVRVARVREVEVSWNVVLGAWNSHELDLIPFLLLNIYNLGRELCAVRYSRSFAALGGHAEGSGAGDVRHVLRVVSSGAQVPNCIVLVALLLGWFTH